MNMNNKNNTLATITVDFALKPTAFNELAPIKRGTQL